MLHYVFGCLPFFSLFLPKKGNCLNLKRKLIQYSSVVLHKIFVFLIVTLYDRCNTSYSHYLISHLSIIVLFLFLALRPKMPLTKNASRFFGVSGS